MRVERSLLESWKSVRRSILGGGKDVEAYSWSPLPHSGKDEFKTFAVYLRETPDCGWRRLRVDRIERDETTYFPYQIIYLWCGAIDVDFKVRKIPVAGHCCSGGRGLILIEKQRLDSQGKSLWTSPRLKLWTFRLCRRLAKRSFWRSLPCTISVTY